MKTAKNKSTPSWSDVKAALSDIDRAGLLALVQDLYTASSDNRTFLHARFALGAEPLKPYKTIIDRWLFPDVLKDQGYSVAKAKKAIADYKKAIGHPDALAELMVYYCERASGFSNEYGMQDEGYYDALIRMFEQALEVMDTLPEARQSELLGRLDDVCQISHNFGYGVSDCMDHLLAKFDD
jgi:hypothetical protein